MLIDLFNFLIFSEKAKLSLRGRVINNDLFEKTEINQSIDPPQKTNYGQKDCTSDSKTKEFSPNKTKYGEFISWEAFL